MPTTEPSDMTAPVTSPEETMATHHFVLVTEGMDLLEWETLDVLFKAGCGDATAGHDTLEFDRAAPTRGEALCSALHDAESVPGVRVLRIEFPSGGRQPRCAVGARIGPGAHRAVPRRNGAGQA